VNGVLGSVGVVIEFLLVDQCRFDWGGADFAGEAAGLH
jgi:hypothetical protein